MNKENILIYCSSRNNYEMLKGEIFENVDFEGFDFVNVELKQFQGGKKFPYAFIVSTDNLLNNEG